MDLEGISIMLSGVIKVRKANNIRLHLYVESKKKKKIQTNNKQDKTETDS